MFQVAGPTVAWRVCRLGKQPVLRPAASAAGSVEYSPLRFGARLSSTSAGAVQTSIFAVAVGSAVTYGAIAR